MSDDFTVFSDREMQFIKDHVVGDLIENCEWTDKAIGDWIRSVAAEVGIGGRDAYVALYWIILGKSHGPRIASIMAEMNMNDLQALIEEVQ